MSGQAGVQAPGRARLDWADDETLSQVRPAVREVLQASEGFAKLPAHEQQALAREMVKVSAYMANPDGLAAEELSPGGGVLATTQADATEDLRQRLAGAPGSTGADFRAGAVREGVQQFGELVKKVDFPKFVSGLIQGVFKAIVDSTIEQMHAYGELLANVAKTVDQFAQDNISENNGRDWLAERFPDQLGVDTSPMSGGLADEDAPPVVTPKVTVTAEDPAAALKAISAELEMAKPVTDLSDENEERRLVLAARLQIARSRQQLLASMVMLGVQRIVVADGLIHAKVLFDLRASDVARRTATASMYDATETKAATEMSAGYGAWFSPVKASMKASASTDHVATVQSAVDDSSESKAEVKANLSGEVRVNFKSDYLPMEKFANPQMISAIQGNAIPPEKPPGASAPVR
jgi:hypothetical protein